MQKSITVLCNTRFPSTAAHGVYLARLCESFAAEGVSVELVVPKRGREVKAEPLSFYGVKTPFRVRKIWSFDFILLGPILRKSAYWFQAANFYLFALVYFLFRSRRRLVYTMDNLGCLLTFIGYRVVFETHVGIGPYRQKMLKLIRRAERLVAVNSLIKDEFVKAGFPAEKILVAPNGVDLALFSGGETKQELRRKLSLPEQAQIVGYVGRFRTMGMEKGVEELARSFAAFASANAAGSPHLLIVGLEAGESTELKSLLKSAGVSEGRFTLVGHVSQRRVALYMRAADCLVMNYPDTPYYRVSMSPMKMFEYMASGNPIVASDLPSIREVLNERNAVIVKPDDQEALVSGIRRALEEGAAPARQARRDAENFTWQNRARKILQFLS